jgi:hypothetical protein
VTGTINYNVYYMLECLTCGGVGGASQVQIGGAREATVNFQNSTLTPDSGYFLDVPKQNGTALGFESPSWVGALPGTYGGFWSGTQSVLAQVLLFIPSTFAGAFPTGCTNSKVGAKVGATNSTAFTLWKHAGGPSGTATLLCTATFGSGGSGGPEAATLAGAGGSVAVGDYLEIDGPPAVDSTLASIGIGFYESH